MHIGLFVLWVVSGTAPQAIDCADFSQPCTGTVCIHQTATYSCGDSEVTCDNDTQTYTGGNVVCCTYRFTCTTCTSRGRTWSPSAYVAFDAGCVANP